MTDLIRLHNVKLASVHVVDSFPLLRPHGFIGDGWYHSQLMAVEDFPLGPRCGKTYAACHDVVGSMLVGEYPYTLMEIVRQRDIQWIRLMLREVFQEYGLALEILDNNILRCGEHQLVFISPEFAQYRAVGYSAQVVNFVDY